MNDRKPEEDGTLSRRELLKAAGLAGIGAATSSVAEADSVEEEVVQARRAQQRTMIGVRFDPHDVVRIGIIGVGLRGTEVLREFLAVDKVVVNAVCDVVKDKCTRAAQMIEKAGQKTPGIYADSERDFERLVARDDLDFIYIATPWEWTFRKCSLPCVPESMSVLKCLPPTLSRSVGALLMPLNERVVIV